MARMCLPAYSLGSTSEIWKKKVKKTGQDEQKTREIGQFFDPVVALSLIVTKRFKCYEQNYKDII